LPLRKLTEATHTSQSINPLYGRRIVQTAYQPSATRQYRSSFIPSLHDVCMVFEKA